MRCPTLVFISHNKADKEVARSLAQALIDQGISIWFDEWNLKPGDSIAEGIERGIAATDLMVLVWSKNAARSNWVRKELNASLYRNISDRTVRVVPVMLDDTPLPPLVADSLGFRVAVQSDLLEVAAKIGGDSTATDLARRLQNRFFELLDQIGEGVSPLEYRFCPMCGSTELEGWQKTAHFGERTYTGIRCKQCSWSDGSEA